MKSTLESFQEGLRFWEANQQEIKDSFIKSFLTWTDNDFYHHKILLAHIVIEEPDCNCEIIALLTSYSITCAGYNILIKNANESWKLHTCQAKLNEVNCDKCGKILDTKSGPCYISCEMIDKEKVSEKEYEEHNSYDICSVCAETYPELIPKHQMVKLDSETYDYFGYNTYSLPNFKHYTLWNWHSPGLGEIKKPDILNEEEYKKYNSIQDTYWNLKMLRKENELTQEYESMIDRFKIETLI